MNFFQKRRKRKFLAELKNRRHAEDDLLSPALRCDFDALISEVEESSPDDAGLKKFRERFQDLPLPEARGFMYALLDLIVVVGAVAFGLRGLYFQPFRIPTSSMQPTLYGIHYMSRKNANNPLLDKIPAPLNNVLFGMSNATAAAPEKSVYQPGSERIASGMIFDRTEFFLGQKRISLPGTPEQVAAYAKLMPGRVFEAGEKISDGFVSLGDHLFVERFSLYLSPPKRGDVMVFTTENLYYNNIPLTLAGGYYYIKRLAAMPGDVVKIVDNQLYIKPQGKDEFSKIQDIEPRFKKIYSMKGGYHGHLSNMGEREFAFGAEYTVPAEHYLMLGDNSAFSMDSRYFGPVHRRQMIGRAWLTFYPLSRRTGIVDSKEPIDVPTGEHNGNTFPVMYHQ